MSQEPIRNDSMYVTRSEFVSLELKLDKVLRSLKINNDDDDATTVVSSGDASNLDVWNPSTISSCSTAGSFTSGSTLHQILTNQENILEEMKEIRNTLQTLTSEIQDFKNQKEETSRDQDQEVKGVAASRPTKDKMSTAQHKMTFRIKNIQSLGAKDEAQSERYNFPELPGFVYFLKAQFTDVTVSFDLCQEPQDVRNPPFQIPDFSSKLHLKAKLQVFIGDGEVSTISFKQIVVGKIYDKWKLGRIIMSDENEKRYIKDDEMVVLCILDLVRDS